MSKFTLIKAIWQVKFPVAAKLADNRGAIAFQWHEPDGELSEWQISNFSVTLANKTNSIALQTDINSISVIVEFPESYEVFQKRASDFTLYILDLLTIRKINRFGLRLIFTEEKTNFKQLTNRLRHKLYKLGDEEWEILGGTPVDLGFSTIHTFQDSLCHFQLGPMEKSQLKELFVTKNAEELLPNVALYSDIDLYVNNPTLRLNSRHRYIRNYLIDGGIYLNEMVHKFADHYGDFE